jgi:prepilin-type N-terminal cleavage/methylation domain-containing protein
MRKAFTLIELLVVIAIIAILAAILFPVFSRAKLSAKRASSLSNVKQLDLSILLYLNDYDDNYPLTMDGPFANVQNWPAGHIPARTNTWDLLIGPYVKSSQLFVDPTRGDSLGYFTTECTLNDSNPADCTAGSNTYINQELHAMYGYNYMTFGPILCNIGCTDVGASIASNASIIIQPANTVDLVESYNFNATYDPIAPVTAGSFLTIPSTYYPGLGCPPGADCLGTHIVKVGPGPGCNTPQPCDGYLNYFSPAFDMVNPESSQTTASFADGHAKSQAISTVDGEMNIP